MNQEIKQTNDQPTEVKTKPCENCTKNQLVRLLYMILFMIIKSVAIFVFYFVALFQFVYTLFKNAPNKDLLDFNQGLSTYLYQIFLFVGYNTETKPFPFSPWPKQ